MCQIFFSLSDTIDSLIFVQTFLYLRYLKINMFMYKICRWWCNWSSTSAWWWCRNAPQWISCSSPPPNASLWRLLCPSQWVLAWKLYSNSGFSQVLIHILFLFLFFFVNGIITNLGKSSLEAYHEIGEG